MAESKPEWPSLEEQLRDAKVRPGSKLEALIMDNQDFGMLRADHANDKLKIPPWLKVYWQKNHPDGDYSSPTGGYPLLLREVYEWMLDHQDLPAAGETPGQVAGENPEKEGDHGK